MCEMNPKWPFDYHVPFFRVVVVKMAPILSRPLLGRLFVPSLSRAMSSGYLVHEPKYSFLRVQQFYYYISFIGPTLTMAKQTTK